VTDVHFVVPDGIDDPARPSGGNVYDRHVSRRLTSLGWSVHEHAVAGFWSDPDAASFAALELAVDGIDGGAAVLIDGLIASTAPEVLVPQAERLRLVALVHMPLGNEREGAVLSAAERVITTSEWSRRRLHELYGVAAHVAEPGACPADLAPGTESGEALLCVAAVSAAKGHDVLLDALATMRDLSWRCECVGRLDREPALVESLRRRGLVSFPGPGTRAELARSYAAADLLVLPSRAETYGMVLTEALARGLPVVASDVGGVTEALGEGTRPGLLVPAGHPGALAEALRSWLVDAELRERLRCAARERRGTLPTWSTTASAIAEALR
jgi:glycosyltransferase involved in cell wall biosynthesis